MSLCRYQPTHPPAKMASSLNRLRGATIALQTLHISPALLQLPRITKCVRYIICAVHTQSGWVQYVHNGGSHLHSCQNGQQSEEAECQVEGPGLRGGGRLATRSTVDAQQLRLTGNTWVAYRDNSTAEMSEQSHCTARHSWGSEAPSHPSITTAAVHSTVRRTPPSPDLFYRSSQVAWPHTIPTAPPPTQGRPLLTCSQRVVEAHCSQCRWQVVDEAHAPPPPSMSLPLPQEHPAHVLTAVAPPHTPAASGWLRLIVASAGGRW